MNQMCGGLTLNQILDRIEHRDEINKYLYISYRGGMQIIQPESIVPTGSVKLSTKKPD